MDANLGLTIFFFITGSILIIVGLLLAISEIISGRHSRKGSIAQQQAGIDWKGIAAVLNAIAAVGQAFKDWKLPALLVFLGVACDVIGIIIVFAKPIR
jgi:hypothetical protein